MGNLTKTSFHSNLCLLYVDPASLSLPKSLPKILLPDSFSGLPLKNKFVNQSNAVSTFCPETLSTNTDESYSNMASKVVGKCFSQFCKSLNGNNNVLNSKSDIILDKA